MFAVGILLIPSLRVQWALLLTAIMAPLEVCLGTSKRENGRYAYGFTVSDDARFSSTSGSGICSGAAQDAELEVLVLFDWPFFPLHLNRNCKAFIAFMKSIPSKGAPDVILQTSSPDLLSRMSLPCMPGVCTADIREKVLCHKIPSYRKYGWPEYPIVEETRLRYVDALLESASISLAFDLVPTRITERVSLSLTAPSSYGADPGPAQWAEAECTLRLDILRALMERRSPAASNEMVRASKALSESQERLLKVQAIDVPGKAVGSSTSPAGRLDAQSMPLGRTSTQGGEVSPDIQPSVIDRPSASPSPVGPIIVGYTSTIPASPLASGASNGTGESNSHIHPSRLGLVQTELNPPASLGAGGVHSASPATTSASRATVSIHPSRVERVYPSLGSRDADEAANSVGHGTGATKVRTWTSDLAV